MDNSAAAAAAATTASRPRQCGTKACQCTIGTVLVLPVRACIAWTGFHPLCCVPAFLCKHVRLSCVFYNKLTYRVQSRCFATHNAQNMIEILIYFSNKIYGSNFIKQLALRNCCSLKLSKCWLQFKKKIIVSFVIIFGTLSFLILATMIAGL